MKQASILPDEVGTQTFQYYAGAFSKSARTVYLACILVVIGSIAALPLITVDVSVRATGTLRSSLDATTLTSPASAVVSRVLVVNNDEVTKGQLIFELRSPVADDKRKSYQTRLNEVRLLSSDARILIRFLKRLRQDSGLAVLSTSFYEQSLNDYLHRRRQMSESLKKAGIDYRRSEKLYSEGVIATVDYEKSRYELSKADGDLKSFDESHLSVLHKELQDHEREIAELTSQISQLVVENENLRVIAPVGGTFRSLNGIYPGSQVLMNQGLAEILPSSGLVAEIIVPPTEIGLIREGMALKMQIDAFDYNQWGFLTGHVSDITKGTILVNNLPNFKVSCAIDHEFLMLRNKCRGELKKGMTLRARLIVARRTIWQLLFDKADAWFNPYNLDRA